MSSGGVKGYGNHFSGKRKKVDPGVDQNKKGNTGNKSTNPQSPSSSLPQNSNLGTGFNANGMTVFQNMGQWGVVNNPDNTSMGGVSAPPDNELIEYVTDSLRNLLNNCQNSEFIQRFLNEVNGDVDQIVSILMTIQPDEDMLKNLYQTNSSGFNTGSRSIPLILQFEKQREFLIDSLNSLNELDQLLSSVKPNAHVPDDNKEYLEVSSYKDSKGNASLNFRNMLLQEQGKNLKEKSYVLLRRLALESREFIAEGGDRQNTPAAIFIEKHFGTSEDDRTETQRGNLAYLKLAIMDKARIKNGDIWGTGSHEWLPRSHVLEALKRSAGLVEGVSPASDYVDYLMIQCDLRSPTGRIIFRNDKRSIESGHSGSVKKGKTFVTNGSHAFHVELDKAFLSSKSPGDFLKKVEPIFRRWVESGSQSFAPSDQTKQVSTGGLTDNKKDLSVFRPLQWKEHENIRTLFHELKEKAQAHGSTPNYSNFIPSHLSHLYTPMDVEGNP